MNYSPSQEAALAKLESFVASADPIFVLKGPAGTGKTTIMKALAQMAAKDRFVYLAPTGKAAKRLSESIGAPAGTVHGAIYVVLRGGKSPEFEWNEKYVNSIAVVDEASMVYPEMAADLLASFKKVVFVGDPFQLPPVKAADWFGAQRADAELVEIHRQALESPILSLATAVRMGKPLPPKCESEGLRIVSLTPPSAELVKFDQILCHSNQTKDFINAQVRKEMGFKKKLDEGDKLVCLRNRRVEHLFIPNGAILSVVKLLAGSEAVVKVDEEEVEISLDLNSAQSYHSSQGLPVDHAYAMTVHKSQGSEWGSVLLMADAIRDSLEQRRWRYTGITRASTHLTWVKQ